MTIGSIVRFRNRDWVLVGQAEDVVFLRPLTGISEDTIGVHRRLSQLVGYSFPAERPVPSRFPLPVQDAVADGQSVQLLWQAARLLLREGAAPLRSLGRISVRPRTYQLVPLTMALRLDPVRLLIADDVGVGKTIEAGLIVRELWERGEVRRMAVLCPPYLCDQWQKELAEKFHLEAVLISPATLGQLERRAPPGRSIYQHYPVQVISIDFIKHERNKHAFLLHAPELLIVDEAHGATPGRGQDRHLRYALVHELAQNPKRHLLLLTATPHSGIPEAFQKLLGLLDPQFEACDFAQLTEPQRVRLARHFVQRTRRDIVAHWESELCFPTRETIDATYSLSPAYQRLFEGVYDFCTEIVRSGEGLARHRRRMRWWGALALLRCVMSSPQAALLALQKRRKPEANPTAEKETDIEPYGDYVYEPTEHVPTDEAPTPLLDRTEADLSNAERHQLRELERLAQAISETEDTKLQGCIRLVRDLLREGHNPIVWCFYIETAEYVTEKLRQTLAGENVHVECLTGRVGEEERRLRVEQLMSEPGQRVLVATDCLSEGINLQKGFSAVIHYDLPWNPNRLEQREGRVDRFEQPSRVVKAVRYYGKDNPVDGVVIRVLLDKAREIHQTLGTYVPIPEDEEGIIEALVHALFFGRERPFSLQPELPLEMKENRVEALHRSWELDAHRERESRTRFAQHALKPEEVRRELEATDQVLGDPAAVRNFVLSACQRLGLQLKQSGRHADVWEVITEQAALVGVPQAICQALPPSPTGRWRITFTSPTPEGAEYLGRNHPFVTVLARYLFEQAFAGGADSVTARCGALRTRAVERLTALFLLRPRFQLQQANHPPMLAEEVLILGWRVYSKEWLAPLESLPLLSAEPSSNMPEAEKREIVAPVLEEAKRLLNPSSPKEAIFAFLEERAKELEKAHRRIRQSVGQAVRGLQVQPYWPPDLLGVLVLQPEVQP